MPQERKNKVLKAIVEIFIKTASPVGSSVLKEEAHFDVSPATLRNEMAKLEKEGFLEQSHSSGGRIPTSSGYRFFVEDLNIQKKFQEKVQAEFVTETQKYFSEKTADEKVYDMLSILTKMTPNIVFSTVPSSEKTFFLGISQTLMLPEFSGSPEQTSGIFRVLEEDFYTLLHTLKIGDSVEIFIGKENIFPEMASCSLLVSELGGAKTLETKQFFGILGPMRMDYARNVTAIQEAKKLHESL